MSVISENPVSVNSISQAGKKNKNKGEGYEKKKAGNAGGKGREQESR